MTYRLFAPCLVLLASALMLLPARSSPPLPDGDSPAVADSVAEERARYVQEVLASIEGRKQESAGEVFEDVEVFADVPAERLLRIMDLGFGRS